MMITTLPAVNEMKPGAAGPALPGIDAGVVDRNGSEVDAGEAGYLTVNRPWPGMFRTLYGDDDRYLNEFWREFGGGEGVYFAGDGATVDEDGYVTVLGRIDDVINVSGRRLGTMEIESAIVDVDGVAEAAVVGSDAEGDTAVYAYVSTETGYDADEALRARIVESVEDAIATFARPETVVFTPDLPKTRSGKIMRRLLKAIANGDELGDTSALRNPEIVGEIESAVERL
jgi:acetyl-CoA synthetase